jgi:uncharacterized protein YdaU (DUF1376 family)
MTDQLPAPLTPEYCDCRDLDGFMLNVERVMASELVAVSSLAVVGSAFLLWCRAWKQMPAASLPDDERVLAAFAKLTLPAFRRVRDEVLRGFVKCSDGRLYHKVLATEAINAYERKVAFQKRRNGDAERLRKWRASSKETPDETTSETRFVAEGQGQGQGLIKAAAADASAQPVERCPVPDAPPPHSPPGRKDPEAVAVVAALNDAIAAAFGEDRRRPYPNATDGVLARRWLDAGADPPLIADVLTAICRREAQAQRAPPNSLKYFDKAVADALSARDAPPTKPSPNGGNYAGRSTPPGHGGATRGHVDDGVRRRGILEACGLTGDLGAG